jgi:extracellular elastinolytic metalloproteinase
MTRRRTVGAAAAAVTALAVVTAPVGSAAASSPEEVALEHVRTALGLGAADVDELEVTDTVPSRHSGVTHVYVRQLHAGLPVHDAVATLNVKDGRVLHTGSRLLADLDRNVSGRLVLDAPAAYAAAARGLELPAPVGVRVLEGPSGRDRATLLSEGGVSARPVRAHLAHQALQDGTARLVWVLDIELPSAMHWFVASVDAETGALVDHTDLVVSEQSGHTHAALQRPEQAQGQGQSEARQPVTPVDTAVPTVEDGSSYNVFALPLESPNDGDPSVVKNPADAQHSPHGWHDLDGKPGADTTITRGNNVHAYADTGDPGVSYVGISAPDNLDGDGPDPDAAAQPDGGRSLTFNAPYTRNDPTALQNRAAAVTNLFYWNNTIHDVLARYGFDEASGNFQEFNYSGQGVGKDSVKAQAQDGGGPNNANFFTPPEGQRPRMQMFLWDPSVTVLIGGAGAAGDAKPKLIDGDFDSGVITHEYGHGVSNRLTGGPSNVRCLDNQEQMGEGWSDYLGLMLTMREGDKGSTPRGMGTYVVYQNSREGRGIRPTPYSTDMEVNPSTYNTTKTALAPHGVGYVWATMLYDLTWDLIAQRGFNPDVRGHWTTGGNNLALQLVMDGMKMQPCSPGFVDGRDAILAADEALTEGANACTIWRSFARRGLGADAVQGSAANKNDGRNGFEVPSECV